MGELRINVTNTITVGLMAFLFLFVAQKGWAMYKGTAAE